MTTYGSLFEIPTESSIIVSDQHLPEAAYLHLDQSRDYAEAGNEQYLESAQQFALAVSSESYSFSTRRKARRELTEIVENCVWNERAAADWADKAGGDTRLLAQSRAFAGLGAEIAKIRI